MAVTVSNSATQDNPAYDVDTQVMADGSHKQWMGLDVATVAAPDTPSRVTPSNPLPITSSLPTTPTHAKTAVGDATSVEVLATNSSRKRAFLINNTAQTFYVKEGTAAIQGEGFPLWSNRYYEVITTAAINVIKAAGGSLDLDTFEAT